MLKQITYSAPAKVILSGEHAVVYGKPALVSAINLELKFSITSVVSSRTRFGNSSKMLKQVQHDNKTYEIIYKIAQKVKEYLQKQKIKFIERKFNFKINSKIPIGRGLGSSAALSTAAVAAFLKLYTGQEFEKEIINNLAYEMEKYYHKNPSGVDNTASCFGGLVYYRKEFEFLKNISALNFKIPKKIEDNLYLIDSGQPAENTAYMVHDIVGGKFNKSPNFVEEVLDDIEKTTKRMVVSLIKSDIEFFQKTLFDNQILLDMLGVVSKKTKTLLKKLEPLGVGKITGAGGQRSGSGFVLFFANKKKDLEIYLKK
ncbi:mevalonate kinase, partial [Candidatus Roizmanbacteria bacterium]|nr:mevalonate kinase [Candidatus Roizmanbacteria bacterium]